MAYRQKENRELDYSPGREPTHSNYNKSRNVSKANCFEYDNRAQLYNHSFKYDRQRDELNKSEYAKEYLESKVMKEYKDNKQLTQLSKLDQNSYLKKQNARTKEFDIKFNKIESINDQITNLLSMVNNEGGKENRSIDRQAAKRKDEASVSTNKRKQPQSKYYEKSPLKYEGYKYEEKPKAKNAEGTFQMKYRDRIEREEPSRQYPLRSKYNEELVEKSPLKRRQNEKQSMIGKIINERRPARFKQDYKEETQFEHERPYKKNYEQKYKNECNDMLPISIINKNSAKEDYLNTKFIDEQIRNVQDKIQQSESKNYHLQKKLSQIDFNVEDYNSPIASNYSKYNVYTPKRGNLNEREEKFTLKLHPVVNEQNVHLIIQKIEQQIELDNRVEKSCGCPEDEKINYYLSKFNIKLNLNEVKYLFFSQETNKYQSNAEGLFQAICSTQNHWERSVYGCASLRELKNEGFSIKDIDISKKGYLQIEDIVSFVNHYTGKVYQNKDLALIFKRLELLEGKSRKGIEYTTFLRAFAI